MAVETKKFRLTVWKPTTHTRGLLLVPVSEQGKKSAREQSEFEFHEAVYSWESEEDVWLSVINPEDQRTLSSLLFERFAPERPVEERGIDELLEALLAISTLVIDSSKTAWMDCEESRENSNSEVINLRCHGMAALYSHLRWVYEIFKGHPGISVTIR